MRKLLFVFAFILTCFTMKASYAYMKYTTDAGTEYYTDANGLVITADKDSLVATVNGTEQLRLKLTSVVSMELVANIAGTENMKSPVDGKLKAFTLDGIEAGEFQSVDEARLSLDHGFYILKDNSGQTIKIQLSK